MSNCGCESNTSTTSGCCSIGGSVPSGQPVRLVYRSTTGVAAGAEVLVYRTDDGSTSPITITSTMRLMLFFVSVVVETTQEVHIYHGTSVSDDATANRTIVRGHVSDHGGIVANLPGLPLPLSHKVWVKSPTTDDIDVVLYGILEGT